MSSQRNSQQELATHPTNALRCKSDLVHSKKRPKNSAQVRCNECNTLTWCAFVRQCGPRKGQLLHRKHPPDSQAGPGQASKPEIKYAESPDPDLDPISHARRPISFVTSARDEVSCSWLLRSALVDLESDSRTCLYCHRPITTRG